MWSTQTSFVREVEIIISWGFSMRAIYASSLQGSKFHIVTTTETYFTLFVINFNNPLQKVCYVILSLI